MAKSFTFLFVLLLGFNAQAGKMDVNDSRHLADILQKRSDSKTLEFSVIACRTLEKGVSCAFVHRSGEKGGIGWLSAAYTFDYLKFYGASLKKIGAHEEVVARNVVCKEDLCRFD